MTDALTSEIRRFGPVWFIPGENRGKYPYCHSVYVEGAALLIDPGSDRDKLTELRDGPGVREIWLSHWHEDHLMHLDLFEGVPLRIEARDAPPLASIDAFMDGYALDDPDHRATFAGMLRSLFHFHPQQPAALFDGDEQHQLAGAEVTVQVLHTPGHTPGHCALLFEPIGVLWLGDYDLTSFGPWYGDPGSSIEQTIASVQRLRKIDARVWLAAHEQGVFEQPPGDAWDRYLHVIDEREHKLVAFLSQPRTMEEIVEQWIVYRKPREPRAFYAFAEGATVGKHLERLQAAGRVHCNEGRYCLVTARDRHRHIE